VAKAQPETLYKPAEACKMAEVAPYVLRYWETEFPPLAESKEKSAGKFYTLRDVKIISRIRELLYDEGFTVAGARKRLESEISEGRFDDGLSAAPPAAQQKKSAKIAADVERSQPLFLAEHKPAAPLRDADPAHARAPAAATDFPERRRVLKELKEIARLLEPSRGR
jgi:DNA-binding transcriptional MerR regulator